MFAARDTFLEAFGVPHSSAETIRALGGVDFLSSGGLLLRPLIIDLPLFLLPEAAAQMLR
jgi:hypothetical protein